MIKEKEFHDKTKKICFKILNQLLKLYPNILLENINEIILINYENDNF